MRLHRTLGLTLPLLAAACSDVEVDFAAPDPPPLSGGTLLITRDGTKAVAADPDFDRIVVVDLATRIVTHALPLDAHSEPGRLVEDGAGRVHVALRRAGTLVTVDPNAGSMSARPICGAPRGLDYDAANDAVHVACATGELVTVPAGGGAEIRRLRLDRDLRDVMVQDGQLVVTRFRSAERLVVDAQGAVVGRSKPPQFSAVGLGDFAPAVAWRTRSLATGGTVMIHQRELINPVPAPMPPMASYYGNVTNTNPVPDSAIVHTAVTVHRPSEERVPITPTAILPFAGLPLDVAVSSAGLTVAVASAAGDVVHEFWLDELDFEANAVSMTTHQRHIVPGQPVAVAYAPNDQLWVQTRRPAALYLVAEDTVIALGKEPTEYGAADAAHDLFHLPANTAGTMACASCHPEGGDDGHRWTFAEFGDRRTPSLRGGVGNTAPFHWAGELADMPALVEEVFVRRMGGADPGEGHAEALRNWLDALAVLPAPAPADAEAAERGRILFEDSTVGCSSCHSGPLLTDNKTVNVNTGGLFQVPSLVGVAHRAPYMHNACAATLHDRFGPCGGGDEHGKTSHLRPEQIDDLVAYLETL